MPDFAGNLTLGPVDYLTKDRVDFQSNRPADVVSLFEFIVLPDGGEVEITNEGFTAYPNDFAGHVELDPGQHFLEHVWTRPARIELGNIITTISREIEIYNAFRDDSKSMTAAAANAGPGVSFDGLPSLPATILAQTGLLFDVVITTEGPPSISGTLDFTVSGAALSIPITGNRVILLPYEPEIPIREVLEFATDILQSIDGSEQRISIRKHPRQLLSLTYQIDEDSSTRRKLNALLFAAQAGTFGIPVWFEKRKLDTSMSVSATVASVDTRYADFRVGSLAIVWSSETEFDALEIDSKTDSSLTFTSGVTFAHQAGALVMPLRTARTKETVGRSKYNVNLEQFELDFTVTDNEADIASVAAFDSHNSKVLLDSGNVSNGQVQEDFERRIYVIDNGTASISQLSKWTGPAIRSRQQFLARTRQRVWEIRQMVHALRGSQVSFYIPTFYKDLVPASALSSGSFELDVESTGLVDTIGSTPIGPWNAIWVRLNDGTVITRNVTTFATVSSTVERLTLDDSWGSTIAVEDVERISFLRLSRIANDRVIFDHARAGQARITFQTLGVQQ